MYHRRSYSTTGSSFFPTIQNRFIHRDLERDWRMKIDFPPVNMKKKADAFEVTLAAPGMKKDEFELKVEENRLIVTGEHKTTTEEKTDEYVHQEYDFHSFKRIIPLPKDVEKDAIEAVYEEGILTVKIPYAKTKEPVKLISVGA